MLYAMTLPVDFSSDRLPGRPSPGKLPFVNTFEIYVTNEEQVLVYIAQFEGLYAFGYRVFHFGARSFDVPPNPEFGLFRTEALAEGYALQLIYEKAYLSDIARKAVLEKIMPLAQLELF